MGRLRKKAKPEPTAEQITARRKASAAKKAAVNVAEEKLTMDDLIHFGSITPDMAQFLEALVISRQNIVVSGDTGSGKKTLLNCLSACIPEHERILTIAEITNRDRVRNALRMRPERIVVDECRGSEILDMLQAMSTGYDGSMTTVHANDPQACIGRLETLVLMAETDMPIDAVRRQIASSVTFIVQAARFRDGSRKVTNISEIGGMEGEIVLLTDIFKFVDEGETADGTIKGRHIPTGIRPRCEAVFEQYGVKLPASICIPDWGKMWISVV